MTAEIYAFECGQLTMPLAIIFENAEMQTTGPYVRQFLRS